MNILLQEQGSNLTATQVAHCAFLLAVVNSSVIPPQGEIKSKRMGKRRKEPSDKNHIRYALVSLLSKSGTCQYVFWRISIGFIA